MKLVRTIHPVGHGCFCTERFYDEGDNNVFNAVYDCGSKTLPQSDLNSLIDSEFAKDTAIDILFISHFHDDHINGVYHFLGRCNVRKVVVPFVGQEGALLYMIHHFLYDNDPNNTLSPLIETLSLGDTISENGIPIDRIGEKSTRIYSGVSIQSCWKYKPILSPPYRSRTRMANSINRLVNGLLNSTFRPVIQSRSPLVVDYNLFRHLLTIPMNFQCLMNIYGSRRWNDNRFNMALFSGSEVERGGYNNCLFTGDYEARYQYRITHLLSSLSNDFCKVEVFQIPHHGSKQSHSINLYQNGLRCFVCDSRRSSRPNYVIRCLNPLVFSVSKVTEDPYSRLFWVFSL